MKFVLRFLIIALALNLSAQSGFNSEGFEVTKQDIELNVFDKDSTANALIIYEKGESYVDRETFLLKSEIKKKLKILNRNGFDKATETIYLYGDNGKHERVKKIKATVYNVENGQITQTQLDKNAIFEEQYDENHTLVKFTFPNIKEGSVIVYSYTLESPYMFKYKSWYFQEDIPKLYSEYRPSIPGNWEYNIKLVGGKKLYTNVSSLRKNCLQVMGAGSSDCGDYIYVMKDIPAFIEEEFMTTKDNYLARIEYELKVFRGFDGRVDNITKTWKSVEGELKTDNDIGRQLKKSSVTKDLLSDTIIAISDPLEKAKAIYEFVQNTYTWDKTFNIFNDVSVKDLVNNKSGNVSEINILLHNLLEANDIDVKPVLLSTRNNGFATRIYPVISDFNYLIVHVTIGEQIYMLDATDDYLSFGQLPIRCLNQYGRLLDFKEGGYWVDINANQMSVMKYRVNLNIDDSEALSGTIKGNKTGYHALRAKRAYFSNPDTYLDSYSNAYPSTQFVDYESETTNKTATEFSEEFKVEQSLENVGGNLYINPFLITFFDKNPFKLQQRTYPIDFGYEDAFLYSVELNVKDYEVIDIPKPINLSLPNKTGTLIFNSSINGDSVILFFKFNFKEAIYDAAYYDSLKSYFATIVDIQKNSLIVLKKKP
ncbi:DUF3857 domain-containing protein [Psychroserpens algicola]|uniref:DUF3857 and transglutaminase domain-containing protein n=1 Tax=Psychroserpens algicola TaxID=1719034 RepID=A0ABT0HBB5_9FLAO|nr:DUF3857 domain-containing protein [Psychroserpens algicola]MCK8481132.1 DUF3857 and transglutaminase domain-containing protein [Psychroserpens algicola]